MDKTYWENYYKNAPTEHQPSLFAQYILSNFIKKDDTLIELGCGNGRDSAYFAHHDVAVHAVDQCDISELAHSLNNKNLTFTTADFTQLNDFGIFNIIYSRFTLHSISAVQEDRVLDWAFDHLTTGGYVCIEARGQKNEIYQLGEPVAGEEHAFIYNDHYRRFVHIDTLVNKLERRGFTVIRQAEEKGFAPYGDTDYTFLRVIATKN